MLLWLTATHGRYKCLQRNLRCYIDQQCSVPSVMFICNSGVPLKLPDDFQLPANKQVYIDNCSMLNFQSVGEKYQHAITLAKQLYPDIDIVTHADDDDIFLPDHLIDGLVGLMEGVERGQLEAYKPQRSWFRSRDTNGDILLTLQENTLEPSIFVDVDWILKHGYAPVSIRYHQQWLDPLLYENKIFIDPNGIPTLIYNWGDNTNGPDSWGIYKMSGAGIDNQQNFQAHKRSSTDMGNGILTPTDSNSTYYNLPEIVR